MTCADCNTNIFNMKCINCAARHCRAAFYPDLSLQWSYVKEIARLYNHNAREIAELVRGVK